MLLVIGRGSSMVTSPSSLSQRFLCTQFPVANRDHEREVDSIYDYDAPVASSCLTFCDDSLSGIKAVLDSK